MIEMCACYTTTGHPNFQAKCKKGWVASLKCHSKRTDCKDYKMKCKKFFACIATDICEEGK